MKKILLDTNFFLVPFQMGVNIMSELDRIMQEPFMMMTLKPLKDELEHIARNGKGDDKLSARLGSQLARNIEVDDAQGKGDDAIINYVKGRDDIIVATNDSTLRKRLKQEKIQTIFVRNKSTLELE